MANADVCSNFHAKHDEAVNFTNNTGSECQLTVGAGGWPFTDSSPLCIPVGGGKTKIKSKKDLPDGTYSYNASCCPSTSEKSVTVP